MTHPQEDWEKAFEKLSLENNNIGAAYNELRFFIRSLLQSEKARIVAYVNENRRKVINEKTPLAPYDAGWNTALDEVIELLK